MPAATPAAMRTRTMTIHGRIADFFANELRLDMLARHGLVREHERALRTRAERDDRLLRVQPDRFAAVGTLDDDEDATRRLPRVGRRVVE